MARCCVHQDGMLAGRATYETAVGTASAAMLDERAAGSKQP